MVRGSVNAALQESTRMAPARSMVVAVGCRIRLARRDGGSSMPALRSTKRTMSGLCNKLPNFGPGVRREVDAGRSGKPISETAIPDRNARIGALAQRKIRSDGNARALAFQIVQHRIPHPVATAAGHPAALCRAPRRWPPANRSPPDASRPRHRREGPAGAT